jgi:CheY-like chemotaxis protein
MAIDFFSFFPYHQHMSKKVLLVDDDEIFLRGLKEILDSESRLFEADICFSVPEAIKRIIDHPYALVLTDLRMPGKSGIDLLVFLREMDFRGKVMVMSAYATAENREQICSLGAVDVIAKPVRFEWVRQMLVDWFLREREDLVTFEAIDLVTVMQIVNLDKKTAALQVDVNGRKGTIYFVEGEIVHAEFDHLQGEPAILKLIAQGGGVISVKRGREKIRSSINAPFMEQMMQIMKLIDEMRRDGRSSAPPDQSSDPPSRLSPATHQAMIAALNPLREIQGFLGALVLSRQGEVLAISEQYAGPSPGRTASLLHDVLARAQMLSWDGDTGTLDAAAFVFSQLIVHVRCRRGENHFMCLLLLFDPQANAATSAPVVSQVAESVSDLLAVEPV